MSKKRAFTLVELLVILTIIAALITILIPVLGSARQIAGKVFCQNNLRQLGICVQSYAMEYKVYPVCVKDVNVTWDEFTANPDMAKNKMLGVPIALWPYHKEKKIYECPMLVRKAAQVSYCYDNRAGRQYEEGESMYAKLQNMPPTSTTKKDYYFLLPDRVKSPEKFVILYDLPMVDQPLTTAPELFQNLDPDDYDSYNNEAADSNGYLWNYDGDPAIGPHRTGYNILFADLKVSWFRTWDDRKITRKPD